MDFSGEYKKVKSLVKDELDYLENNLFSILNGNTPLEKKLLDFLKLPSKRLRPVLGFLFLKTLFTNLSKEQKDIFVAVELIHNATLIHDDVIDNSELRRGTETLNLQFDNNLAVIAGDFLLSVSMEKIIELNSIEVIKICTSALKKTCLGEVKQYFSKFTVPTIEDYIKKSEEKTALLFEIGILGGIILSPQNSNETLKKQAVEFTKNFGIAFQIRDDILNLINSDKIDKNDFNEGIYTAPIIFAKQNNDKLLEEKNILDATIKTGGIEKAKDLMDNYFNKAALAIKDFDNNVYKEAILKLIQILRESI